MDLDRKTKAYLREIGRRGGRKSRRHLSPEVARNMVRVREAKRTRREHEMKQMQGEIHKLVEEYRDRCLWFLRPDYWPDSREHVLRTLDLIERYGDRAGYKRAEEIRTWLLQDSKRRF